jgi:hypothetical protein
MPPFIKGFLFAGVIALVLSALSAVAQQNPQRLILKDGSYQTATKWELKGNRVRYYSAERYTWEELPNDLVDWPATNRYNSERESDRSRSVEQVAKEDEAAQIDTPMVAPGLRLPDGGGVFLLDSYQNGPQLIELSQESGEINKHMGHNILRAAINPLALSSKQTIELKGARARTQAHLTQPTLYASVDAPDTNNTQEQNQNAAAALDQAARSGPGSRPGDQTQKANQKNSSAPPEHYRIVRMEKTKDGRIVGNLNVAIYGKVSQKENWVQTETTSLGPEWVKITPAEPLAPGEYALVEILDKGEINLFVWDFGVDPSAPANINAWTARRPEAGQNGQQPGLEKRPPE